MEATSTAAALAAMGAALDAIRHEERARLGHADRLALVTEARRVLGRTEALAGLLVAEADRARASVVVAGTPTTSWLQGSGTATKGEAAGLIFGGRDLAERPVVRDAALTGQVTVRQARAIAKVLGSLPIGLSADQRVEAERILLGEAAQADAERLGRLGPAVLERVAPSLRETADGEQRRLEAQRRRAHAARSLSFSDDGDGSWRVTGSLPHLLAAPLLKIIDARVESARRTERDSAATSARPPGVPVGAGGRSDSMPDRATESACRAGGGPAASHRHLEATSTAQRRADALCALAGELLAGGGSVPRVAGDRPRVVVTMSFDALRAKAEQAGRLEGGQAITAGDLRRLCCDADVVPAVLGGASEVLDVGRAHRLVPPGLRRALGLRDRGCAFPTCDAPDPRCEAHHIVPWWAGGATSLTNLVLLCPHHHGVVEPPRFWSGPPPDRWTVRVADDGLPEFVPPRGLDPSRTPQRGPRGRPSLVMTPAEEPTLPVGRRAATHASAVTQVPLTTLAQAAEANPGGGRRGSP